MADPSILGSTAPVSGGDSDSILLEIDGELYQVNVGKDGATNTGVADAIGR